MHERLTSGEDAAEAAGEGQGEVSVAAVELQQVLMIVKLYDFVNIKLMVILTMS